jgi:hypothetical protein
MIAAIKLEGSGTTENVRLVISLNPPKTTPPLEGSNVTSAL